MLKKKGFILLCAICAALPIFLGGWTPAQAGCVQITDKGAYYLVDIDARSATHADIGTDLATEIASAVPDFESIIDSYIAEVLPDPLTYSVVLARVNDILPQVPTAYKDEVNAMIAALELGTTNAVMEICPVVRCGSATSFPMWVAKPNVRP